MMTANFRLSAENRTALRRAISQHSRWPEHRSANGLKIENMSAESLLNTAGEFGIDLSTIVDSVPTPVAPIAPVEPVKQGRGTGQDATELANALAKFLAVHPAPVDLSQVNAAIDSRLAVVLESIAATASEVCEKALSEAQLVKIECKGPDGNTRAVEGHKHPKLETLLKACSARMANGFTPSVWLCGPAGSGKTHAAEQIAQAFGFAFRSNGALSMPHELLGFVDAAGNYHRTAFREAYEHGGVYLFDEVDGSDNAALLALNAALANGFATFPDGQIRRHHNCIIIAAANTFGLGATADYVGRAKIDAAFLSRFPVRIFWDYDSRLEIAISGNESFARRVQDAREKARKAGIKVLIDPRASQAGGALIAAGFTEDQAAEMTYLANLTPEQRRTVGA